MKRSLLFCGLLIVAVQALQAQISYTWTGASSTSWATATNWSPSGVPGSADNVTIVTGSNICKLASSVSINNLTLTSGTLDLNAGTLTVNGTNAQFTAGTVQNGTLTIAGATSTVFGNGPVTMNCTVNISSAAFTAKNTTFQLATSITKTGASNDASSGNNVFNGALTATNAGSGYLMFGNGNGDQFNAAATFVNTGSANIYVSYSGTPSTFNGVATFTNSPSTNNGIYVSWNTTGTVFNNNIVVNSTSGTGVQFSGGNGTATTTLASGRTIAVGATGFTTGTLLLRQFTQSGATAQNITLTTAGVLQIGPSSVFNGNFTATTPALVLNGGTFNGITNLTKTGASGDWGSGGNIYNGVCTITNSGSSYLVMGNNNPDTWNGDVTFTDNGSERILPGWGSTGNQFNGNIYVNTSGSAIGVQFCGGSATATATLAAGKTISAGAGGLTAGYLYLQQFTQLGNAAINLTATGTSVLYLGPSSTFGGTFTASAPDIWAQGATYNSAATFTKTGGSNNHNNQNQNIFNSTCTINQQSSTGYFMLGYNSNDLFNDNITVTSTGGSGIYLGWGSGTGTPTLAAGKTIQVGAAGFSAGFLYLNTFTQLGNAAINLSFTGTNTYLAIARSSVIGGNLTTSTPDIYFNGGTFNGTVSATKTGANNDFGSGGNTFQASATFTATGTGALGFGNGNPDIWNGPVTFTSSGSSYIAPCWNSAGNQFNGNISVNSTGSSTGILFCNGAATSTATLAAGNSLQIGSGGFSSGNLQLRQFTQLGTVPVNLTLTGATTVLVAGPTSSFAADFSVTSPRILLQGATFNGNTVLTKTGATGEWSSGGNTFNSTLTINQQGSGYFGFANVNPDIYNGDTYINNNSTERVIFANNASGGTQFNGNIIVTQIGSSVGIAFGWSGTTNVTQAAGKTFTVGAAGFTTGYLQIERFTQLGNAPITLNLGSSTSITFGPNSSIGGNVTTTSGQILFNGCTFNGNVNSTKTGTTNDWSSGGNVFSDSATITDAGSGYIALGNVTPDQFNGVSTFNNTGSANMYIANNSSNNTFGGTTTFNNSPTANTLIYVSQSSAGTVFNGNIVVTSTNGQGVYFCSGSATATATLSAGDTLQVGPAGFSSGVLYLRQFTALGNAPTILTLTGATTLLQMGPSSAFGGDFTAISPRILVNGAVFSDTTILTKTGATGEWMNGGNTFNSALTINMQGGGFFGWEGSSPDIFNGDVYVNNNSTERVIFANNNGGGTQFNGNVILTQTGSSVGIAFGWSASTNETMAAGKTISIGAAGFTTGYLQIERFTQLGNAAVNLPLTGNTALTFGPNSAIGGDMTSTSGSLYFNGCTFSGICNATKTGATSDWSSGNNIFNGVTTITDAGSGYMVFGNGNADQFNNNATFNNTGGNNIYVAYNSSNNIFGGTTTFNNSPTTNSLISVSQNSAGTVFNGNIVVTSTSGQGVQFCTGNGTATASLSSGYTISVGAGGFSAGTLLLRQFTQSGPTPQSLTLTGTGNLTFGPSSAIGGNIVTVSPTLFFNGCTFSGTVTSTKNGATSDASSGNNLFNAPFIVTNTGAGYFLMGNGNPDIWQSTAAFNNYSPAQHMYVAYNSTGNTFNGDVSFNNQPGTTGLWIYSNYYGANTAFNGNISVQNIGGAGIYFGPNSGNATLSNGSVSVGAGGFASGSLIFRNFTQSTSGAAQTITTTGTSNIQFGPGSAFSGPVTTASPGLLFNGCVFNGSVNSIKNGATNDQSAGGNTFNGPSTLTNTGTGYLMMTNTTADTYNGNMVFVQGGTGKVYPNYNNNSAYNGNLTVTSPAATAITFGAGSGTATFSGSGAQTVSVTPGTPAPVFTRAVINNTGSGVTLSNTNINVSNNIVFSSGLLNTTTSYMLVMLNNSTTAAGTALSTSYVNGPMQYQKSSAGASTLNFPVGNAPDCRPFVLTVSHTNGTLYSYTAQLYDGSASALNWTLPLTVDHVSQVHYWTINRADASGTNQPTAGLSGTQTIQIFFGTDDYVSNGGTLTICKNVYTAPTTWIDIGGAGGPVYSGGSALTGSITSTSAPSLFNSFSTFTLGDKIGGGNVLPIGLLEFNATPENNQVDLQWTTAMESNNNYFTVERSIDGSVFDSIARIETEAPDGNSSGPLNYTAVDPHPFMGLSYYRLKQTDLNGHSTWSTVVSVDFARRQTFTVYPNPSKGAIYVTGLDVSTTNMMTQWFDMSGKLLTQAIVPVKGGSAGMNVNLNNGIYLLKLTFPDGTSSVQNIIILK
ncbi:MAG TPA: T9SS type A sorting domain-containing protein [Puia sp.]|nr:T9SS type A sorting domain-containing protein [Puia sp.]